MFSNRFNLSSVDPIINKLQEINKQYHQNQLRYSREVSCLQTQNFFRRNRPTIFVASCIILFLAGLTAFVLSVLDMETHDYRNNRVDNTLGPEEIRNLCLLVGAIMIFIFTCAVLAFYCMGVVAPCLTSMNELPIPPNQNTNNLNQYLTEEQTKKIIALCIRIADAIDPLSDDLAENNKMKLFFPDIDLNGEYDESKRFAARVDAVFHKARSNHIEVNLITISLALNMLEQLKKLSPKIKEKNKLLIQMALNDCGKFCVKHDFESTPLLKCVRTG